MDLLSISNTYSLLKPIPIALLEEAFNSKALKIKTYSKDEIIHFDGDICRIVEILLLGKVVVERIDESGNLLIITEFYPDDILGGNLIFSKNPHYPMTVTAKSDTTILEIQKELLFELCSTNKDFLKLFLEYISDHALLLGDKIKHYVNRSIRESLVAYLKNAYMLQNSNKIMLNMTKKEIADRMGVQRTSLSRELQKMKNEGLILFDTESITILDTNMIK
ncbi:MAG: Crp/Fnr family transcriptional regulator [Firmicutes bacterium HGW-Firmicutes-1]|jgi:CRP-like cAMP-binding protein|nr:MAG: Crp/Fnr family transcriptional regulator [Firmicutes bacterium HGW-Firmicutes-1]